MIINDKDVPHPIHNSINILNYQDYRIFLNDLYTQQREAHKRYSYRQFAEDLGFKASNFLHLVIGRKRGLSDEAIGKMQKHIDWTAQEKKYFYNLVHFNQAATEKERLGFKTKLDKLMGDQRGLISEDEHDYFSKWYIPILKETVGLKGFVSHLNWIAKKIRPRLSEDLIKDGLQKLERLGLLKRQNNRWIQTQEHLTTSNEVTSNLIHGYHKQMLELSVNALGFPAAQRDISSMTMSLSAEQFHWLKERVIAFRDEIQQEFQDSNSEATLIAQLNIQLFPVTE